MNPRSNVEVGWSLMLAVLLSAIASVSCERPTARPSGITPEKMADALHTVMAADRTIYTRAIVNRLQNEEKIIKATEHWNDEKTLPLPAQMFRMGAEEAQKSSAHFSYALLSLWPINKQNGPKTDVEKNGLRAVADHPQTNYYSSEKLGGRLYFTAIYPDKAISSACIQCHNTHPDSPRHDFKEGEVLGGVVIRIPLD